MGRPDIPSSTITGDRRIVLQREHPMGDDHDDVVRRMRNGSSRFTDQSLRKVGSHPPNGEVLEVEDEWVYVRLENGVGQRANTNARGAVLSARAVSLPNELADKITGSRELLIARGLGNHDVIPSIRKFRLDVPTWAIGKYRRRGNCTGSRRVFPRSDLVKLGASSL